MRSVSCFLVICAVVAVAFAAEFIHVKQPIDGKFIIVMNDETSIVDRDSFLDTVRGEMERDAANASSVTDVFDIHGLVGYFAALSPSMLEYHMNHPMVKYVEPDQIMSINYQGPSPQEPDVVNAVVTQSGSPWGLARISRQAATTSGYSYPYDSTAGAGVEVWVVDTGVYSKNTDFGGRASTVYNAISGEPADDLNGHGTHCAGTAAGTKYGVAKKATIYGVKVLGGDGSGTNSGVLLGIQYVTKNHGKKAVANMSLGGGFSQALNDAVTAAVASGVAFAVAAGNENQNACNTSPASCPAAVTVGSITYTNARSSFSNYGKCLDIFAPGSDILSDWIGSTTATNTISGTSMASPHVAGVLAQQLSLNPTWTTTQLVQNILAEATSGQVTSAGTSSPNLIAYSPY